jgi:hypothetical protein
MSRKEQLTCFISSMVFQGDLTNQFNNPPFPLTIYLKAGSITPAISRTEVNVFSSINPATCRKKKIDQNTNFDSPEAWLIETT